MLRVTNVDSCFFLFFFRYIIGSRLLNIFTEFYIKEVPEIDQSLTPSSPEWIGAWWLGFILIFILRYHSYIT